jgi:hypothetical protein
MQLFFVDFAVFRVQGMNNSDHANSDASTNEMQMPMLQ